MPKLETALTKQQEQLLRNTRIDQTQPGTILPDFEVLLNFVREQETEVTGSYKVLPTRALEALNSRLSRPLQHRLTRPQQKSYPHINGLYLLLRASGLTTIGQTARKTAQKSVLLIDEPSYQTWVSLNPTERYCVLLETWLLRGHSEIIGEWEGAFEYNGPLMKWHNFQQRMWGEFGATNDTLEDSFRYTPGFYNLALLELFGLVEIDHAPPLERSGWHFTQVRTTAFGEALFRLVWQGAQSDSFEDFLADPPPITETVGQLQPILQPYFPAWQKNLSLPSAGFRSGMHIFKVALDKKLWRRIAIPAELTLEDLSDAILAAYDFDYDHLYEFIYATRFGTQEKAYHAYMEESPCVDEVEIGALPVALGDTMVYHYDFGDDWRFQVTLERIDPSDANQTAARIIEAEGKAPEQYPSYDHEAEDEEDWEVEEANET